MNERPHPLIAVLTDFGLSDAYVAEMKSVILSHCPNAVLLDISHDIARGDIRSGAYILGRVATRLPEGTIVLAVVDPGVGTGRLAVAVANRGLLFVAPDNGLLARAIDWESSISVRIIADMTAHPTFHGRDLFAPAAAMLAAGIDLTAIGARGSLQSTFRPPLPQESDGRCEGGIVYIDRFGNAATNIPNRNGGRLVVAGHTLRRVNTYGEAHPGEAVFLNGSDGCLELAVRDASAAELLSLNVDAPVSWVSDDAPSPIL